MSDVPCTVKNVMITAGDGSTVPGVRAICALCGHSTESFGRRGRSLRRCLKAMTAECPRGETNDYQRSDEQI